MSVDLARFRDIEEALNEITGKNPRRAELAGVRVANLSPLLQISGDPLQPATGPVTRAEVDEIWKRLEEVRAALSSLGDLARAAGVSE